MDHVGSLVTSRDSVGQKRFDEWKTRTSARCSQLETFEQLVSAPTRAVQAVCNLVCCLESQLAAIKAGAIACLKQLVELGVPEVEVTRHQVPRK